MDASTSRSVGERVSGRRLMRSPRVSRRLRSPVVAAGRGGLRRRCPGAAVACGAVSGRRRARRLLPWQTAGPYPRPTTCATTARSRRCAQQDNYSTCWIQSAMASLESCLLPGALFDLSENNLANHMGVEPRSSRAAPTPASSTAYFARWDGPVLERDDPYPRKGRSPEGLRRRASRAGSALPAGPHRAARQRRAQVGRVHLRRGGHRRMAFERRLHRQRHLRLLLDRRPASCSITT